jgi:hypothetical protein
MEVWSIEEWCCTMNIVEGYKRVLGEESAEVGREV